MIGGYWYEKIYDSIGRGVGFMLIISGILMVVVTLVFGSRKSIREVKVINCGHELKNATERP